MPCLKGRFPVAIDVQSIGESGGFSVATRPMAPRSTRLCRLGILPASMSGWMAFQSAASQPMKRIFCRRSRTGPARYFAETSAPPPTQGDESGGSDSQESESGCAGLWR